MKLLIFIPDGVGIKNYLYSNFFEELKADPGTSIAILSSLPPEEVEELAGIEKGTYPVYGFPGYREGIKERLVREAIRHARLAYHTRRYNNDSFMSYRSNGAGTRSKALLKLAAAIGSAHQLFGYDYILRLEKWYNSIISSRPLEAMEKLLARIKPDVILSTHQRPRDNVPVYEAAKRLGIHRASVIYSWDNVAKSALYTPSEKYFLWSSVMKEQMLDYYPEIPESKLVITGTPQFSFYHNTRFMSSREAFCARYGIPPEKPMVLFSGSDTSTSPYDDELLEDVASVIQRIPVEKRPTLIFRRSPADYSKRFDEVLARYPGIIAMDPVWVNRGTSWNTAIPTRDDIRMLVGLMQHVTLIINVGSTMALDGAIFGKPCMYLAYSPEKHPEFNYGREIHTSDHFRVMKDLDAVVYVHEKSGLDPLINQILEHPETFCPGKKAYLEAVTNNILEEAGPNIIRELKALCGELVGEVEEVG